MEDQLYQDQNLVQFYDFDNPWEDEEYLLPFTESAQRILDLGCGTGRLATVLTNKGKQVVGVEYAKAMLDVAKTRSSSVQWVQGDARTLELQQQFDLIILSGHVFQVFLTPEDQMAVLQTIKKHLLPTGHFLFDSRNPLDCDWITWTKAESLRTFTHPTLGSITAWNTHVGDAKLVTYSTHYTVENTQKTFSADSPITFSSAAEIVERIQKVGLHIEQLYGDWQRNPFREDSPEIIVYGSL